MLTYLEGISLIGWTVIIFIHNIIDLIPFLVVLFFVTFGVAFSLAPTIQIKEKYNTIELLNN
jgi:hypothetical protein